MNILRNYKRDIIKKHMKNDGLTHICKHSHSTAYSYAGKPGETTKHSSYFAENWKTYTQEVK